MTFIVDRVHEANWSINSKVIGLNKTFETVDDVKFFLNHIQFTMIYRKDLKDVISRISFLSATQILTWFFPKEFEDYITWYIRENQLSEENLNLKAIFSNLFERELSKCKRASGFTDIIVQAVNKRLAEIRFSKSSWETVPEYKISLYKNVNNSCQWKINESIIGFRGVEYSNIDNVRVLINDIFNALVHQQPLILLLEKYSISSVISVGTLVFSEEFKKYLIRIGEDLISQNKLLGYREITKIIFGTEGNGANYPKEYVDIVNNVVQEMYAEQYDTVSTDIDTGSDTWELIFKDKNVINKKTLDFSFITTSGLKKEVKRYLHTKIGNKVILESRYKSLKKAIPYLQEKCGIKWTADITLSDVKNLMTHFKIQDDVSVSYMLQINATMKEFVEWVIEHSDQLKTIKPKTNYFKKVSIPNLVNMIENTEYIPEEIIDQMLRYIHDLKPMYQRLFLIMLNTGLHFKDTAYLKANCHRYDEDNDIHFLEFIQWKNLKRRRKAGLSDSVEIPIHHDVAKEILKQIEQTKELREKSGLEEIFIHENRNRVKIHGDKGFVNAVNKMIMKNDIRTQDGEYWHFTTRQCRKTLAVDMIMNQASPQEVSYYLVHGSENTTARYYAEVRKYKLAEMNSEFWEKEFKLVVPEKQLKNFSLEDRKKLFVDFKLQVREVELGMCMKPVWEGVCDKRTGSITCATCNKLCTGLSNLNKWEKLQKSQQRVVDDMVYMYEELGISDYETYRDYQKETYLLNSYNDVVNKIYEKFGGGQSS